jgi:ABC-type antimicrobial peptide transport system permease subunit
MTRWLNPSQPQTLQAAVILGYLSAVFGLLGGATVIFPLFIGIGVGAFATANNKRWGYILLAVCSFLIALFWIALFVTAIPSRDLVLILSLASAMVFPIALAIAVLHAHSREYQKVWFE